MNYLGHKTLNVIQITVGPGPQPLLQGLATCSIQESSKKDHKILIRFHKWIINYDKKICV